jgi:hypothetical protein
VLFALSLVLVFGLVATLITAAMAIDPTVTPLPVSWLIHARTPVGVLVILAAGLSMGLASTWRNPRWFKFPVVGLEILGAGLFSFYFLSMSFLPERTLDIAVGDSFPAYELLDQDRASHQYPSLESHRALYIFYRGDW